MRKAVGRAALVLAAGLLAASFQLRPATAAPAESDAATAEAGKPLALTKSAATRPAKARVHKASSGKRSTKVAALRHPRKTDTTKAAGKTAPAAAIPDQVANANAQMPTTDVKGGVAASAAATVPPGSETPAASPVLEAAAADQLTELDRALAAKPPEEPQQMSQLSAAPQPQAFPAPAATEPAPPVTQARAMTSSDPAGDPWAQSSLIGKIFIAFGGMLTLASAARMLIA